MGVNGLILDINLAVIVCVEEFKSGVNELILDTNLLVISLLERVKRKSFLY